MFARVRKPSGWGVVAFAIVTAIAAFDAALAHRAVLIGLLMTGPIVAALRATPRETVAVSAYAFALGVLLGFPDDIAGSVDHFGRLAVVAVGSGLGVLLARERERHEQAAILLATQHEVARSLAEWDTLAEAAPKLLQAIGERLSWELGEVWEVRPNADSLTLVETWCAEQVDVAEFADVTREMDFRRGVGLPGTVWDRNEPVWIVNVTDDRNFRRAHAAMRAGLQGAFGFPIRSGKEVIGVVAFYQRQAVPPDPPLLEAAAALGRQIGQYLKRRQTEEAVRASEARKAAILESALDCVITMDHKGRVVEFNPAAEETFGYARADAVGKEMAALIIPPAYRDQHRQGLANYLATGEGPVLGKRLELTGIRADGTEFPVELAITRIDQPGPPMFTGYLRDITERRQAEEELERIRQRQQSILHSAGEGIFGLDLEGKATFVNPAGAEMLGWEVEELIGRSMHDLVHHTKPDGSPYPIDECPIYAALTDGSVHRVTDEVFWRKDGTSFPVEYTSTPLDEGGKVSGAVVVFADVTERRQVEEERARLLGAEQAARERAETAEKRAAFLAEVSAALNESLEYGVTLKKVAHLVVPDLADWCSISVLRDNGSIRQIATAHVDPDKVRWAEELGQRYPTDPDAPRGVPNVIRTGEPELLPEIPEALLEAAAQDEEHLRILRELGLRSAMIVPLKARGRTFGALTLVAAESARVYTEADLAFAQDLGDRCAIAVDNSRLFSERTYIARTLQESLLPPHLPEIPGLELAARYQAAGEGAEVGGDFYDIFNTRPGAWGVVIGDVVGKGAGAAALTGLARHTLRAAAMQETDPRRILGSLNEAIRRETTDESFCTAAYTCLEMTGDGVRLDISSGGHPLPLLLHPDGTVEEIGRPGTLLGIVPDPDLARQTVDLKPGDAVVLYTDGVPDARSSDGLFGDARLKALVASCAGEDAAGIADRIEHEVLAFGQHVLRDDVAVLVLRVREEGEAATTRAAVDIAAAGAAGE